MKRMRGSRTLALLLAVAAPNACGWRMRRHLPRLPAGDAVWFEEGIGSEGPEALLARGGFASVFLPAVRVALSEKGWVCSRQTPPARPLARLAVFLVIDADRSAEAALAQRSRLRGLFDALTRAADMALANAPRFGTLRGIHLEVPFSAATAQAYGELARGLRKRIPQEVPLTASLRFSPQSEQREKLSKLSAALDGFLAVVFDEGSAADPVATDRLGKAWWAGYAASARGRWTDASGLEQGALPERVLARLSDDPAVHFTQEITLREETASGFSLRPQEAVSVEGIRFAPGSRVAFRQPSLPEMIYHLGADLAGRRFVRGRVFLLGGRSESERIFTLAALDDLLTGGRLDPDLRVSTETGSGFVRVLAENVSAHASVVSRTTNWVEVEVPGGGIRDVQTGGFDRYEVFGADGRPVALGRAVRVRFYETLVGPFEKIEPARILLRRGAPPGCCAARVHLTAAAGKEVSAEFGPAAPAAR